MLKDKSIFEAGDVVRLKASIASLPMTIEDVCSFVPGKGIGVRCAWFDEQGRLCRDVFDPTDIEHAAPTLEAAHDL